MQSFIQYRKFRRVLEAQVERANQKSRSLNGGEKQDREQQPGQHIVNDSFSDKDVEKGDTSQSSQDEPQMGLSEADLERENPDGDPYPQQNFEEHGQNWRVEQPIRPHHPTEEVEDLETDGSGDEHAGSHEESLERQSTQLSRFPTHKSRGSQKPGMHRTGTALGAVMTGVEIRKRSTNEGGEGDVFIVGYENEEDIMNPHNWSVWKRAGITFMVSLCLRSLFWEGRLTSLVSRSQALVS